MKKHIALWGAVAVLAMMLGGTMLFGCGSGRNDGENNDIPSPPSPGIDVSMGYNGSKLTFNVGWPGAHRKIDRSRRKRNRSIASKTQSIEFAITGPLIANPPKVTVLYPDTIVRIDAPAGPGRYLRATEYDSEGKLVKKAYIYLGLLDPNTPRTGLDIVLLDEHFTGADSAGVAIDLELGGESPFLNINTAADIDLETTGAQNVSIRWYRVRIETLDYYTFRLMRLEAVSIATANRIEITMIGPDGSTKVADGAPVGTEDTGTNPKKQSSATSMVDVATSATIPPGTFYLRVQVVVDTTDVAVTTGSNNFLGKTRVKHETVPVGG